MSSDKSDSGKPAEKKKDRAMEVANTFEWLITAFILAFVFRAFVMEAFRIPTGSMADTLKGAHFRLACPQCGYKYEYGFVPSEYGLNEDTVPANDVPVPITRCPNCGRYPSQTVCRRCGQIYDLRALTNRNEDDQNRSQPPRTHCPKCGEELSSNQIMPVANGDRILVLKCIYQFLEPKRWDVIVFKNPPDPTVNYIKRLVGLPGETVQVIDGDIYINGKIARKPPKVQNDLWMPVYDNDYQPVRPAEDSFNGHSWRQPFKNVDGSRWVLQDPEHPTVFHLDSPADQVQSFLYDTSVGNDFRATYAYDDIDTYNLPYCSDLMVRFSAAAADSQGSVGIALSKYQTNYKAWVDYRGEMVIAKQDEDRQSVELARKSIEPPAVDEFVAVRFANVDHELVFEFGDEKLTYDMGRELGDAGQVRDDIEPRVEIFGSGKLALSHIGILRDIHYTEFKFGNSGEPGRATRGKGAFVLEENQFFVMGDNSPNSEDCRWWTRAGRANKGLSSYRVGIVPRDYLVGKALFVYWPSGFKPFPQFRFGVIPNIGRMRLIYGGSNGIDN